MSASLASFAFVTLFYGIYTVLFSISLYFLVWRHKAADEAHKKGSIFRSVIFVSVILLFLVVTGITMVYRAFVGFGSIQHGTEAEIFFGDSAQSTEVALDIFLSFSMLIGDSLIVHRLWVVWSYSRRVLVVPVLSIIAFTIGSSISTNVDSRSTDIFSNPWLKVNTVLTLIANFYCTGTSVCSLVPLRLEVFITWRIWTVTSASILPGGNSLRVRKLWAVFFAATFAAKSNL
ncbi:hypothetical protein DFH07DRAFT_967809 [Mycena maculata]|uniref:Uncharacterized protein n=1 Tax=Mycena maculata TaxID=230809 RepID=A0AAD7I2R8_9AGAR|nr:hypothetical protein DFH07DRAFT_967809 [Mycena maculata]